MDRSMDLNEVLSNASWMRRLARRLVGDDGVADEVVQDTCLAWWLRPPEDAAATRGWLGRVVRNLAWRRQRQDSARLARESRVAGHELREDDPSTRLERAEIQREVFDAVLDLPPVYRATILARFFEERTVREIATEMDVPVDTVHTRLRRGMEQLRRRLDARHSGWALALFPDLATPSAAMSTAVGSPIVPYWILGGAAMKKIGSAAVVALVIALGGLFWLREPSSTGIDPGSGAADQVSTTSDPVASSVGLPGVAESPGAVADPGPASTSSVPSLSGMVTSSTGGPVAGARVIAIELGSWESRLGYDSLVWEGGDYDHTDELQLLASEYGEAARALPRARTGTDGSYALYDLPTTEHRILVQHENYLPDLGSVVRIGAVDRHDVSLSPGASVVGRVVGETGASVPEARVTAIPSALRGLASDERLGRLLDRWHSGAFLTDAETRTDREGSFRLAALRPERYDVRVELAGYPTGWAYDIIPGGDEVEIVLPTGGELHGVVLTHLGSEVPGAQVILDAVAPAPPPTGIGMPRIRHVADPRSTIHRSARTDSQGRYSFSGLAYGDYRIEVRIEGRERLADTVELLSEKVELPLVLSELTGIEGQVLDPSGAVVADAQVWVEGKSERGVTYWGEPRFVAPTIARTRTGHDGRFWLDGLEPGLYRVWASSFEHAPVHLDGVEAGSRQRVTLELGEGATLVGRVIDRVSREAIPGARVQLARGQTPAPYPGKETVADAEGSFELPGLPDVRLVLIATHPTDPLRRRTMRMFPIDKPLEVEIEPIYVLQGVVRTPGGVGVEGARVQVEVPGGPQRRMQLIGPGQGLGVTNAEGAFAVDMRSPRRWNSKVIVVASHSDLGRAASEPIGILDAAGTTLELVLQPGATATGQVTDESGTPVEGATVTVARQVDRRRGDPRSVTTDRDGVYEIDDLTAGDYELAVRHVRYAPTVLSEVVIPETGIEQPLVLRAGRSVFGRVVDSAGTPIPGSEVIALLSVEKDGQGDLTERARRVQRQLRGTVVASTRTNASGEYHLESLPEDGLLIYARKPGYEPSLFTRVEDQADLDDLELIEFASIGGLVRSEAGPVSAFTVTALAKKPQGMGPGLIIPRKFNERDGEFLFESWLPGEYLVVVHAPGFMAWGQTVTLTSGQTEHLDIRLESGLTIEGTVRDDLTGEPVRNVLVIASSRDPDSLLNQVMLQGGLRARTGADGRFVFTGAAEGEYSVWLQHRSYRATAKGLGFTVPHEEPLSFEMRFAGQLQGAFNMERSFRDFIEVLVELRRLDAPEDGKTPIVPRGGVNWEDESYRVSAIPPGRYEIVVKRYSLPEGGANPDGSFTWDQLTEEKTSAGIVEIDGGVETEVDIDID